MWTLLECRHLSTLEINWLSWRPCFSLIQGNSLFKFSVIQPHINTRIRCQAPMSQTGSAAPPKCSWSRPTWRSRTSWTEPFGCSGGSSAKSKRGAEGTTFGWRYEHILTFSMIRGSTRLYHSGWNVTTTLYNTRRSVIFFLTKWNQLQMYPQTLRRLAKKIIDSDKLLQGLFKL